MEFGDSTWFFVWLAGGIPAIWICIYREKKRLNLTFLAAAKDLYKDNLIAAIVASVFVFVTSWLFFIMNVLDYKSPKKG